jgi:nicotinamidase/pyrazinamidase
MKKTNKRVLLVIDVQNDFCPGGALEVREGDQVVPVINRIMDKFDVVIASKDWHPEDTVHFQKWPVHCVRNTKGSEFHPELHAAKIEQIFLSGTGNNDDGYSAFEATNDDLTAYLRRLQPDGLYLAGLATDYCVKHTALDACAKGFNTFVLTDAIRAVNVQPGDDMRALEEMEQAGCTLVRSEVVDQF